MKISITARTDVGHERDNNEDAYIFCPSLEQPTWTKDTTGGYQPLTARGAILAVADGMGGLNAGEVASRIATDTLRKAVSQWPSDALPATDAEAHQLLRKAITQADAAITQQMIDDPSTAGMGTTIVVCWLLPDKAHVAWCGDSRCYLYSAAQGLRPLTKDHSYVQQLVDSGELTEEEAFSHPDNNVITRGLGDFDDDVCPDIVTTAVSPGDTLLLCSDGLCGYCTADEIAQTMALHPTDTRRCADSLLRLALDAGSEDNICVAVATILADDDAPGGNLIKTILRHIFK